MRDAAYDISDYLEVNPSYGTLDDFKNFLAAAHERGMQVMVELVINHTSDQHPWFQAARHAPKGSPERDYYVWNDTDDKYKVPASSLRIPRSPTGPGTQRHSSTTGIASSLINQT